MQIHMDEKTVVERKFKILNIFNIFEIFEDDISKRNIMHLIHKIKEFDTKYYIIHNMYW